MQNTNQIAVNMKPSETLKIFRGLCTDGIAPKGFTLIELLVVVVIVGVLTTVALPQYQRAVDLAQAKQALAIQHKIVEQQRLYFLANGSYASLADKDNLNVDFQLPKGWIIAEWINGRIVISAHSNEIYIYYFFSQTTSNIQCKATKTNNRLVNLCRALSNGNERSDLEDWRKVYQITL